MTAILHQLDQRRLIDSNGIAASSEIFFYLTGTLTPADVYTDSALTTPHPSPIVVNAGAAVPVIYLDSNVTYRRKIIYPDGSVDDTDPYTGGLGVTNLFYSPAESGIDSLDLETALRLSLPITPFHFGAVGDGATDDLAALQAFNDYVFNDGTTIPDVYADWSGKFGISGTLNLGPSAAATTNDKRWNVGGELLLKQLTATFVTCNVRNFNTIVWNGRASAIGIGSTSFASRTCGIGFLFSTSGPNGVARFTGGVRAFAFWYAGIYIDGDAINDALYLGTVRCYDIGSGHSTANATLTATWATFSFTGNGTTTSGSAIVTGLSSTTGMKAGMGVSGTGVPANTTILSVDSATQITLDANATGSATVSLTIGSNAGSDSSTGQTCVLKDVTAFPDSAISTYNAVGDQILQVRINGYLYYVNSFDSAAGTINIFPWLDPAAGSSGSLDWVIGGAVVCVGQDANFAVIDHLQAQRCGRGLSDGSLYGTRLLSTNISTTGTAIAIGRTPGQAHIGTCVDGMYVESTTEHVVHVSRFSGTNYSYINSAYALDLAKVWAVGDPRTVSGTLSNGGGGLGERNSTGTSGRLAISANGTRHVRHMANLANPIGSTTNFTDHSRPPCTKTVFLDSQTVNLKVVGSGENNRLFGYTGNRWCYVGTGTNGAPTGTITFTPPSGGTINGGAVDASATFTGFSGMVDFEINHTDTAQLTWIVKPGPAYRLTGSKTWDPASVAAAGSATTTVTVTGAALGGQYVAAFDKDLQGMVLTSYVSAADTVTAVLFNPTAGAIDLASGTLTVRKIN